ncbi:MAG: hypothetical protein WBD20_03320 [Pirellulaceae bacterium]
MREVSDQTEENPYHPTIELSRKGDSPDVATFLVLTFIYLCILGAALSFAYPWLGRFTIVPFFVLGTGLSLRVALTKRYPAYIKVIARVGCLLNLVIGGGVLALFVWGVWFWSTFDGPG